MAALTSDEEKEVKRLRKAGKDDAYIRKWITTGRALKNLKRSTKHETHNHKRAHHAP